MKYAHALLAIFALIGVAAADVAAQGTDLSGRWSLDRDASDIPQGRGGGGRGGGGRGGFGALVAETLLITQSAASLTVEQSQGDRSRTVAYALDGSETTIEQGRGTLTATARWDGGTLVTSGIQELDTPRGNFSLTLTELRTLSADGETLVIESTREPPRGERTMTLVYRMVM